MPEVCNGQVEEVCCCDRVTLVLPWTLKGPAARPTCIMELLVLPQDTKHSLAQDSRGHCECLPNASQASVQHRFGGRGRVQLAQTSSSQQRAASAWKTLHTAAGWGTSTRTDRTHRSGQGRRASTWQHDSSNSCTRHWSELLSVTCVRDDMNSCAMAGLMCSINHISSLRLTSRWRMQGRYLLVDDISSIIVGRRSDLQKGTYLTPDGLHSLGPCCACRRMIMRACNVDAFCCYFWHRSSSRNL